MTVVPILFIITPPHQRPPPRKMCTIVGCGSYKLEKNSPERTSAVEATLNPIKYPKLLLRGHLY